MEKRPVFNMKEEHKVVLRTALLCLKLIALLVCSGAFGWKVMDSYFTYAKYGTGTNVEIRPIAESEIPLFAVCRHPNQVNSA